MKSIVFAVTLLLLSIAIVHGQKCFQSDSQQVIDDCTIRMSNKINARKMMIAWSMARSRASIDFAVVPVAILEQNCFEEMAGKCYQLKKDSLPNVHWNSAGDAFDGSFSLDLTNADLLSDEVVLVVKTTNEDGEEVFAVGDMQVKPMWADFDDLLNNNEQKHVKRNYPDGTVYFTLYQTRGGGYVTQDPYGGGSSSGGYHFPAWALAIVIPVPIAIVLCCCLLLLLLLLLIVLAVRAMGGEHSEKRDHRVNNVGSLQADGDDATSYRDGRGGTKTGGTNAQTNKEYPETSARLSLTHQDNVAPVTDANPRGRKHIIAAAESSSMRDWREQ